MTTDTVVAGPYQARQCPECKVWIFTDLAPYAEDDPTKTLRDYLHWFAHHGQEPEPDPNGVTVIDIPWFTHNSETVEAVIEET